jgi:hypothetical protein
VLHIAYFSLIVGQLYKMGPGEIPRRCVMEAEHPMMLEEYHEGIARGNYARKAITQKVL